MVHGFNSYVRLPEGNHRDDGFARRHKTWRPGPGKSAIELHGELSDRTAVPVGGQKKRSPSLCFPQNPMVD